MPSKNKKPWYRKIKPSAFITSIAFPFIALILGLVTIPDWLDNKIEKSLIDKINDQSFHKMIAAKIKPEFLIDATGSVISDRGGMAYFEDIHVVGDSDNGDSKFFKTLTLTPKEVMEVAPKVKSLNNNSFIVKSERGDNKKWILNFSYGIRYSNGIPDILRVEIVNY